ncbi:hypothetical protein HYW31_01970 [Candidatus Berkelbacteria bacterium]|nr:hypothetical protein [Candidatus Berkelbacteria bacterium]
MNQLEKKEMVRVVGEALEDVVLPQLQEIRDNVSIVKEDVKYLKEDVKDLKEDVKDLKEDVTDLKLTTYRIETKLNAEILRLDEHSIEMDNLKQKVSRLESLESRS